MARNPPLAAGNGPTAEEQCEALWLMLKEHNERRGRSEHHEAGQQPSAARERAREWPSYDSVISNITQADYSEHLQCPHDLRFVGGGRGGKTICPHGVLCKAKIELFDQPSTQQSSGDAPYTGLLTPGRTVEHCIVRLSSAMRPPNDVVKNPVAKAVLHAAGNKLRNANMFPCCAIKSFRGNNVRSGNLLTMGSKVGQSEMNYFEHCQATQLTGRMNPALKPLLKSFWKYSDHPLSLGLSDYCSFDADGNDESNGVHFPYVLILKPVVAMRASTGTGDGSVAAACPHHSTNNSTSTRKTQPKKSKDKSGPPFDAFLDNMERIESGTILFDLFSCPEPGAVPDPSRLQRIGRVVTTSEMIPSLPNDSIFFRHQIREEDFALRPGWREDTKKIKCSVGKDKGSIAKLAGWELFEEQISSRRYIDFESLKDENLSAS